MKKFLYPFSIITIISWILFLKSTDSIFAVYLVLGIASLFALRSNRASSVPKTRPLSVISAFFSLLVILSNYRIFGSYSLIEKALSVVVLPVGGFLVFRNILAYLRSFSLRFEWKTEKYKMSPKKMFLLCFLGFGIIFVSALLLCCYPGVLTSDSTWQLGMIKSGAFSNHHPFYHTILIEIIYVTALNITGNHNLAVFCYTFVQSLIMAAIFSYAIVTLYQLKLNKKIIAVSIALFALLPCHIVFSFTIWKDVLFAGGVLLFIVSTYRCLCGIGKLQWLNLILVAISSLLICLFRNNGFYAFIVAFVLFVTLFRRSHIRLTIVLGGSICLSFILYSLLPAFNVAPSEPTESYSIPLQQIARVVVENGEISDDEKTQIERLATFDDIKNSYKSYISDPVKLLLWTDEKEQYLADHKMDYLKLWASIGVKNPGLYAKAWIDQTKGYWNGGYNYWNITLENAEMPDRDSKGSVFYKGLKYYVKFFNDFELLRLLLCIGLYVWGLIVVFYLSAVKTDKSLLYLSSLPLFIVATLLIATPVYAEFRYAYSLVCCLPFLATVLFVKHPKSRLSKK